jgi:hypothetical protein
MATRVAGSGTAAVAALFTSLIAPVLVTVITQAINAVGPNVTQAQETKPPAALVPGPERDIVIGHGQGATPDAASGAALRNATLRALEAVLPADRPLADRLALCETIRRSPDQALVRWNMVACRREMVDGAVVYRAEVTTEFARAPLQALATTSMPTPAVTCAAPSLSPR